MNIFAFIMIHIGQKIKNIVEKKGMAKTELARRMNMTSSNVHKIFTRKTIDTGLLIKLSEILEYDFFKYYPKYITEKETAITLLNDTNENPGYYETLKKNYETKIETLIKEINYLKEINQMLKEKLEGEK